MRSLSAKLVAWHAAHGRHDLPWQQTKDPYSVWLSEVMLQQTQVETVLPYFRRFLKRFPDVASLAAGSLDEVLRLWAGLGYYSRARNMHLAAQAIRDTHGGEFPQGRAALQALPGVGRTTAAAIAVFAFGAPEAILDGNVKRVLARHFAVDGSTGPRLTEQRLWSLAESLVPRRSVRTYTQALMDLGATVCTRAAPRCMSCPLVKSCAAYRSGRVAAFPAPRPTRTNRLRNVAMILLLHKGRILLERRPPHGIWGGLWSLPETDSEEGVSAYCATRLGCEVEAPVCLESLRHRFTHFTLDIRPCRCEVKRLLPHASQVDRAWFSAEQALDAGVPAPVRTLLDRLARR